MKFVIKQVYEGRVSASVRKMFKGLAFSAFNQFITDKIQERLEDALKQEADAAAEQRAEEINKNEGTPFTQQETAALNTLNPHYPDDHVI